MQYNFQLSCESTVDLPYSHVSGRDISVVFYTYAVDGKEYVDDMGRDENALPEFFRMLAEGKTPATSQINEFRYEEYFEELLQKGDVLHIAFSTGLTPSYKNAVSAAERLKEKYPDRKLVVIDSLCGCSGYGLLIDTVADMRDSGSTMEEIEEWVLANRNKVHHQFFSTDLTQFKRSGRVSGLSAMLGTMLGICPLMHLNNEGRIIAYSKVRGKKAALKATVEEVMAHIENGKDYKGEIYIGQSNCMNLCNETIEEFEQYFPDAKKRIKVFDIGTIISAHCGPGTVAIFFYGDERGEN